MSYTVISPTKSEESSLNFKIRRFINNTREILKGVPNKMYIGICKFSKSNYLPKEGNMLVPFKNILKIRNS